MIHGIILTDNLFLEQTEWVSRGTGAHRIATWLRQHGYNIEVVDYCMRWTVEEWQQLLDRLVTEEILFLGVGANLFYSEGNLNHLLTEFRNRYPSIPIIVGGNNLIARDLSPVDYLIEGYAESAILDLLDMLSGKKSKDQIKFSPKSVIPLIDTVHDYPVKDTHDLSVKYMPSDFVRSGESLGLETSRGCIFKCKFCSYPLIGKKKFDYMRDPETIYQEMLDNYNNWGTTNYMINEDTFNDRIEKIQVLANLIEKLPFRPSLMAFLRLDLVLARPEIIPLLRKIGLRGAHFGIETFTRESGIVIGKGKDPQSLKQGLNWFKDQLPEVTVACTMIVGLPYDDWRKHYEYLEWFKTSKVDYWSWAPLYIPNLDVVLHSSEFSQTYRKYGLEPMTQEEIAREVDNLAFQDAMQQWQAISQGNNPTSNRSYQHYLNEQFQKKIIFWKNPKNGDNYLRVSHVSNDLNSLSQERIISPWAMFNYRSLGYEFEEMMQWTYHHEPLYPRLEIEDRSHHVVSEYKKNKINFDYSSQYQ